MESWTNKMMKDVTLNEFIGEQNEVEISKFKFGIIYGIVLVFDEK